MTDNAAWTAFSALLGFLVVFRTSQAYTRFWAGCSATHSMRMEWFNACVMFLAYARISKAPQEKVKNFQGKLIRLFSIMHAAALAELEEINVHVLDPKDINAFQYEVIDPAGFDEPSLRAIKGSTSKVELIFAWVQMLIVESAEQQIINVPAPVLGTALRLISEGLNAFNDALRITYIPFPFPYAQTCDCLLVLHWIMTPIVVQAWVTHAAWAGVLTFMQVFIVQALNSIAAEIENPFGSDANDLDSCDMQKEINVHLAMLVSRSMIELPKLTTNAIRDFDDEFLPSRQSLLGCLNSVEGEMKESHRNDQAYSKAESRAGQRAYLAVGMLGRQSGANGRKSIESRGSSRWARGPDGKQELVWAI
eukprot:CAMPEP_0172687606 /NCGR_PEP_ID=MMETSP1074-20121228/21802_1 /TAXON_ID=2916 /ORGANISM="Ceratium fusus, Strain PA161109" /LENGTH=363 /DNA_ID=CAMNT_0013507085 /DNA_START=220 /DNA_END=1311 /DNA_ORIENTATION=+